MTSLPTELRSPAATAVEPDGRPRAVDDRPGSRLDGLHPAVVALILVIGAYAALSVVTVGVGLVLGSSALGGIDRWDESVNRWFVEQRTTSLDQLTSFASNVANTPTVVALAGVVVLLCAAARRWRDAGLLVVGLTLEVTVFLTTALLVGRERPDVPKLDDAPPTSSFPSGHTAAAVVLYVGLVLLCLPFVRRAAARVALFAVALLIPIGVGTARVYRGMHHPTDVFGGAALGAACLVAALVIVATVAEVGRRRHEEATAHTAPVTVRGGP